MGQIPKKLRRKLDPKFQKLSFMGYCEDRKRYRLINPTTRKITFSRDVKFFEREKNNLDIEKKKEVNINHTRNQESKEEEDEVEEVTSEKDETELSEIEGNEDTNDSYKTGNEEDKEEAKKDRKVVNEPRRSKRKKKAELQEYITYYAINEEEKTEPLMVEEALQGPDSQKWKESMESEINPLMKNESYEKIKLLKGKEILKIKWVFTEKKDKAGKRRFKARLVIKAIKTRH